MIGLAERVFPADLSREGFRRAAMTDIKIEGERLAISGLFLQCHGAFCEAQLVGTDQTVLFKQQILSLTDPLPKVMLSAQPHWRQGPTVTVCFVVAGEDE